MKTRRGVSNAKIAATIGTIALVAVLMLVIFVPAYYFLSYEQVGINDYGIKINTLDKSIDESKVYERGNYDIGITSDFIRLPRGIQTIEYFSPSIDDQNRPTDLYPIVTLTMDGLEVSVEISFDYRLSKETIIELYTTYPDRLSKFGKYEGSIALYVGQGRTTIRDAVGKHTALELINNRILIQETIFSLMEAQLKTLFADLTRVQLRDYYFTSVDFIQALSDVQVAKQQYQVALNEQAAAIIRAETKIFEAQAAANVTILEAEATAEAFLINMKAQAEAVNITLSAQTLAYYAMSQTLNLTSTELLSLLWILAIQDHDSAWLIIGVDTPIILPTPITNGTRL